MVIPYALQEPKLDRSGRQNPHCFLAKKIPVPINVCSHNREKEQGFTWGDEQNCQSPWTFALSLLLGSKSLNNHKCYSVLSSSSAQMLSRKKAQKVLRGSPGSDSAAWQSWNQNEGHSFLNQESSAHLASLSDASFANNLVEFL